MHSRVVVLLSSIIISLFSHSLLAEYIEIKDKNGDIILSFYTFDTDNYSEKRTETEIIVKFEAQEMICNITIAQAEPTGSDKEDIVTQEYRKILKLIDYRWDYGSNDKYDFFKLNNTRADNFIVNYYFAVYKKWRIMIKYYSDCKTPALRRVIKIFELSLTFGGPAPNTSEKQDTE
ncbi:MAG: hypothetical protein JW737_00365 [Acidobacteria bacterium]|nr:hypothetical protein [Acidobacteriota bacterium]